MTVCLFVRTESEVKPTHQTDTVTMFQVVIHSVAARRLKRTTAEGDEKVGGNIDDE